jgi:hypothetical protein
MATATSPILLGTGRGGDGEQSEKKGLLALAPGKKVSGHGFLLLFGRLGWIDGRWVLPGSASSVVRAVPRCSRRCHTARAYDVGNSAKFLSAVT